MRTREFLAVCIAIIVLAYVSLEHVRYSYEVLSLAAFPSAARAYAYGERHFSTESAAAYNPNRAAYFFRETIRLDPRFGAAYHELARLEFLRGNFTGALVLIDQAIDVSEPDIPSSHYVKGLIEGYMGRYDDAARDYATYIAYDPTNWAATNDLAWVLLKDGRNQEALEAIDKVLPLWRDNAWLLNSRAIALYEVGRYKEAQDNAQEAREHVENVTESMWSMAYPGNDPKVARQGIATLKGSIEQNMHMIEIALASSTIQ